MFKHLYLSAVAFTISSFLLLPDVLAATVFSNYTVRQGDSLSKIARTELGDMSRWKEIAEVNRLRDANRIYPGQVLLLPTEIDAVAYRAPVGSEITARESTQLTAQPVTAERTVFARPGRLLPDLFNTGAPPNAYFRDISKK